MISQQSHSEFKTLNPATGAFVTDFPGLSDEAVDAALAAAHSRYQDDWRGRSVTARAAVVARAAAILRANAAEYAGYATLEMGKLTAAARAEVELSADILDYYAEHAERFLAPQALPEAPGSTVVTDPLGVLLAIEPWNFPYYQLARVVGPQLMAGNVVMVKHAPNVPQCALAFARLFEQAGASPGVYTNLFANVEQVGRLIDDFRIRGVTLTGSERAGVTVAERAGRALKKSVLELGGSDPFIVLQDAPLTRAIEVAQQGRMRNMGQSCVASKRFIVVGRERGRQFLDGLKQRMSHYIAGDPADPATTLGPLVTERALQGLLEQIEQAKAHGATVALGGRRLDRPGFYLEPTILSGIDADNPIFTQETFGPVASFYVVDDEDAAIALTNATPFGLGATIFSADHQRAQQLARRIDSGMVFINSGAVTRPELPFGGVKNSGFGRELSELGIGEFVNRKLIYTANDA